MPSASHLIILLHGIGASGAQLRPLASGWAPDLPSTRFVAPDAPFAANYGTGHQWFSVDGQSLQSDRIALVRSAFDALVTRILEQEGFANAVERVAFVGVSQGAIVALDAVASGRWQVGALVSFAGLLPPMPVSTKSRDTPVLLVHGADDRTIPAVASQAAGSLLSTAGFAVEVSVLPATGHTISARGGQLALAFLQKAFAG